MDLGRRLRSRGYRLTPQREAILGVLRENAGRPLSPEDIHAMAGKKQPGMGIATIYRTMDLFCELGIAFPVHLRGGYRFYEINLGKHHHHMECIACGKRFTTYEKPEINFPVVVKKDGRRTEYAATKLRGSFAIALRKRPVSTAQVDAAIERIEEQLLSLGLRELASSRIGELVMRELKKLDQVAYIRYASVYRSFEDIDEFKSLVDEVRR